MDIFLARQPIFNIKKEVSSYELLFRAGGEQNAFDEGQDKDQATLDVITATFLLMGIEKATGGKRAFINFTRKLLKKKIFKRLPAHLVVVEITEDIQPDEELVDICRQLKAAGFQIALDDFIFTPAYEKIFPYVDIIKVDFLLTQGEERRQVMERIKLPQVVYLAEKVETDKDYQEALSYGYTYFQGYFFSRPEILSEADVPSYKAQYLRVLQEINFHDLDYDRIEEIIKYDVGFSYKLLRYVNSVSFGLRRKVRSVRHALTLLGCRQVSNWVSLLIMRELGRDKPAEVMILSVVRARFGELLVQHLHKEEWRSDIFIMGLFSVLDCLLNRPLEAIFQELPLQDAVRDALLHFSGPLGDLYNLILTYERGNWSALRIYADKCEISTEILPDLYLEAIDWTDKFFSEISG